MQRRWMQRRGQERQGQEGAMRERMRFVRPWPRAAERWGRGAQRAREAQERQERQAQEAEQAQEAAKAGFAFDGALDLWTPLLRSGPRRTLRLAGAKGPAHRPRPRANAWPGKRFSFDEARDLWTPPATQRAPTKLRLGSRGPAGAGS